MWERDLGNIFKHYKLHNYCPLQTWRELFAITTALYLPNRLFTAANYRLGSDEEVFNNIKYEPLDVNNVEFMTQTNKSQEIRRQA